MSQLDAWDLILQGWDSGSDMRDVDPTDPDVEIEVRLVE